MAITKVPSDMIQVANNVTDTTIGGANSGVSVTFDSLGVISAASNVALSINTADISDSAVTDAKISAVANSKITGVMTTAQVADEAITASKLGTTVAGALGTRNLIINGDMRIDQRNAGASVTPANNDYCLDRFGTGLAQASKYSVQQVTDAPTNFTHSLKVTSLSAYTLLSGDYFMIKHKIEGNNVAHLNLGSANAQEFTLSFYVKSSLTGTFGGSLENSNESRAYPFTYTISSANTWERVSVTVTGDTTGTWLTDNSTGLWINFGLGVGTTYSGTSGAWAAGPLVSATGATSVVSNNAATWQVTGVQLEIGDTATPFEHRPYDMELQRCKRYYEKSYDYATTPGTATTYNITFYELPSSATGYMSFHQFYEVEKRAGASITFYDAAGNSGKVTYNGASHNQSGTAANVGSRSFRIHTDSGTNKNNFQYHYVASAEL